jgi:GNAT superfamily N-acetyltransferase
MSSSLIEALTFRRPVPDDVESVARIVRAEEERVRGESSWGVAETLEWWRWTNLDESWIADDDGGSVAFGVVMERAEHLGYWGSVEPRYEGRGISTELLRRTEERARERGFPKLTAGMFGENTAARELLERRGFREVRRFCHMRIDFDSTPSPPADDWPEGITISTFRPEDARAFHDALGEAMADDWSHVSVGFEEWKRRRLDAPGTDTSLWFIARAGDEIAGVLRGERQFGGGWIGALGVRRPWRRRGIGSALLRHAFAEYHRRGESHVALGVDTKNPTGATRVYERAGMRVTTENVLFEKDLT